MKNRSSRVSSTASNYATEVKEASTATVSAMRTTLLTHEQIAERARALWLASGCKPGRDVQNWCEAEAQLKAELKSN